MENQKEYTYKLFIKRHWKDLIKLFLIMCTIIGLIILRSKALKIMDRISEMDKEHRVDYSTGKYRKKEDGTFEEIIMYIDYSWSHLMITMMMFMPPISLLMVYTASLFM